MALRSVSSEILAPNTTTHSRPSDAAATVKVVAPSTPQSYQVCILVNQSRRSRIGANYDGSGEPESERTAAFDQGAEWDQALSSPHVL